MISFTVRGFVAEGGRYFDRMFEVFAESPAEATEKALRAHANLVISSVYRAHAGGLLGYY